MRQINLTGREASVIKALGFTESKLGNEIQDYTQMQLDDVADTLNGLMAAGFVESIPFAEEVQLPYERSGTLIVFKVFEHLSYGLVIGARAPMRVADRVYTP